MEQRAKFSKSVEDYLKTIYELTLEEQTTSTNQIAARLNVAPASVTSMLKKLSSQQPSLAHYERHHGVRLSDAGRDAALQIIRRHRLLEQFLLQVLGYSWDEIHEEAENLEHAISPKFEQRMAQALGEPDFDPHGDPIPRSDLSIPHTEAVSLSRMRVGQSGVVRRVRSSDAGLLRYLGGRGIRPEARIEILEQVPFDRTVHVRMNDGDEVQVLGADLSVLIMVEAE
jgi:DtxR family Mn-dependent transcriptional regulator